MANMDIGSKVSTHICKWQSSLDGQCSPWGGTGKYSQSVAHSQGGDLQ